MFPSTRKTAGATTCSATMTALRSRLSRLEKACGTPVSGGRTSTPVIIDGVSFPALEVGFAWYDPETAIADAKTQIDQLRLKRYATAGRITQAEQSAA